MLPGAHFATVYAKPKGREMVDTFITEVSQDTWIFFPLGPRCRLRRPDLRRHRLIRGRRTFTVRPRVHAAVAVQA